MKWEDFCIVIKYEKKFSLQLDILIFYVRQGCVPFRIKYRIPFLNLTQSGKLDKKKFEFKK